MKLYTSSNANKYLLESHDFTHTDTGLAVKIQRIVSTKIVKKSVEMFYRWVDRGGGCNKWVV